MSAASLRLPEPRRTIYRYTFLLATVYNTVWGVVVVLFPRLGFELLGIDVDEKLGPIGLLMWQCIGMFVGVFAIGYWYCWRDPERYAPFILIATLGKVFGPIGFVYGWLVLGEMPGVVGLTILTNDLIWWPIFFAFVYETILRPAKMRA